MHPPNPDYLKARLLRHLKMATREDILERFREIHGLTQFLVQHLCSLTSTIREKGAGFYPGMSDESFGVVFRSMREESHAVRDVLRAFDERTLDRIDNCLWATERFLEQKGRGQDMRMVLQSDWSRFGRVRTAIDHAIRAELNQPMKENLPLEDPLAFMRHIAFS